MTWHFTWWEYFAYLLFTWTLGASERLILNTLFIHATCVMLNTGCFILGKAQADVGQIWSWMIPIPRWVFYLQENVPDAVLSPGPRIQQRVVWFCSCLLLMSVKAFSSLVLGSLPEVSTLSSHLILLYKQREKIMVKPKTCLSLHHGWSRKSLCRPSAVMPTCYPHLLSSILNRSTVIVDQFLYCSGFQTSG